MFPLPMETSAKEHLSQETSCRLETRQALLEAATSALIFVMHVLSSTDESIAKHKVYTDGSGWLQFPRDSLVIPGKHIHALAPVPR